jgi:hypothetical protein
METQVHLVLKLVSCGLVCRVLCGEVIAQTCDAKLLAPNVTINTSDVRSRAYLRDAMCSMNYQEFQNQYGGSGGFNYFEVLSGKLSYNQGNYEKTRSTLCKDRTSDDNKSSLLSTSATIIPDKARELYVDCVRHSEFGCNIVNGEDIGVYYNPPASGESTVYSVTVKNGVLKGLKNGDTVPKGEFSLSPSVTGYPFRFTLTVLQNKAVRTCTVYLPQTAPDWSLGGDDWICQSGCVPVATTGMKRIVTQNGAELSFINPLAGGAPAGISYWIGSNRMPVEGWDTYVTIISSKYIHFDDGADWVKQ